MRVHELGDARERAGHIGVVRVEPHDPVAARLVEAAVPRHGDAAVGLVHDSDAAVFLRELVGDLWRRVGGAVIDDDGLPVGEVLRLQALHRIREMRLAVIDGYDDRKFHGHAVPSRGASFAMSSARAFSRRDMRRS